MRLGEAERLDAEGVDHEEVAMGAVSRWRCRAEVAREPGVVAQLERARRKTGTCLVARAGRQ